jgi:hypothetical protein
VKSKIAEELHSPVRRSSIPKIKERPSTDKKSFVKEFKAISTKVLNGIRFTDMVKRYSL